MNGDHMSAHEFKAPPEDGPPANDASYHQRLRVFDMHYRLHNGHAGQLTTVARNSTAGIEHVAKIFGESLKGVKPLLVL